MNRHAISILTQTQNGRKNELFKLTDRANSWHLYNNVRQMVVFVKIEFCSDPGKQD